MSQNTSAVETNNQFYHYDSLGTTRNLSDADAIISDSYFYEAFGDLLATGGETDNNYLYTGEQYDAQLDNYYLRARYYNQGSGRFTQMDEWYGKQCTPLTLNKYLYTHSDPINGSDPSGYARITDLGFAQHAQGKIRQANISAKVRTFSGTNKGSGKTLTKKVGCIVGQGFINANKFSGSQGHHPVQQSLGGASNQNLIHVMQKTHSMLHSVQNLFFREAGFPPLNSSPTVWTARFENNEKAQRKAMALMLRSARFVDKFCGYKKPLSFTYALQRELAAGKFKL